MTQSMITPICFVNNWKELYIVPIIKPSVEFIVPGDPRGKERPRTVRLGNRITTYTPKNTVNYENLVRNQYKQTAGNFQLQNAVRADITAIYSIPKSASKKKREAMLNGQVDCTKKPDCDNIGKVILDSLNEVAYHDDSQVTKLYAEKKYGEIPKVIVKLSEL